MSFFKRIFGGKEKPSAKTIELDDLDLWLRNKTEALDERTVPLGKQVRAEIFQLGPKVKKLSEELLQHHVPEDVLSAFRAPAENARKHFARGIATIVGDMELKEPTSYLDVVSLQSTINDALNSVQNLRVRQGRYVAEFFPGVYREIIQQLNRLHLLAKQLERTIANQRQVFDLLQRISSNKNQIREKMQLLAESRSREAAIEADIDRMNRSIAELRKSLNHLRKAEDYLAASKQQEQIMQYKEKIRHLEQDIYRRLSLLARIFRKYVKQIERSDRQINMNAKKILEGYLREPTQTFLNEADGYPQLKALLAEIREEVTNKKLQLRQRSREKTLLHIDKILADGLMPLKQKRQELTNKLRKMEEEVSSSDVLENLKTTEKNLSDMEHLVEKLREKKENLFQTTRSLQEDISRLQDNLEEQLTELDGAKIKLKVKGMANIENISQETLENHEVRRSKKID